jgi:hypothetical protein
MQSLPDFEESGDLPPGIYRVSWQEIEARFAVTPRRRVLFERLQQLHRLAFSTDFLERFVVFGSFVTTKLEPGDVDIILVMRAGFQSEKASKEARPLFNHEQADQTFGASVFWIRPDLLILESVDEFLDYWQTRRDGGKRGIIELES